MASPCSRSAYRVRHEQAMLRRVLAPGRYRPVVPKGVSRLGSTDLETVQSLYADGEATGEAPDCFMPAILEHGVDDGVYEGDWLIAAAGTHGVAPTVGVGALGHVYTRCDRRGRGLASRVTSAVTSHLWDMKSSTVCVSMSVRTTVPRFASMNSWDSRPVVTPTRPSPLGSCASQVTWPHGGRGGKAIAASQGTNQA